MSAWICACVFLNLASLITFTIERAPACMLTMAVRWRDKLYDTTVVVDPDRTAYIDLDIGTARDKQKNYPLAVKAYERAADRYNDRPTVAAEALFRAGTSYRKQAAAAEYDQSTAGKAIATYTDFMALFPNDARVPEAQNAIAAMKTEQARGNFQIAEFYEKRGKLNGALVYFNEVLVQDPNSAFATQSFAHTA